MEAVWLAIEFWGLWALASALDWIALAVRELEIWGTWRQVAEE